MNTTKLKKYLAHARDFADRHSKDRSTKVSALFLHPTEYTILTRGYNGIPRGCADDVEERHARPLKYEYTEHAERNGIYNVVRPLLRGSIAVLDLRTALQMDDARALISVGTAVVLTPTMLPVSRARLLLEEAGVVLASLDNEASIPAHLKSHKLADYVADAASLQETMSADKTGLGYGTLFLHPTEYTSLAEGYSGMPRGANDAETGRYLGAERQFWVESGVRNAIYNAARPLLRGSHVVSTLLPCADCARALAAVGAKLVGSPLPTSEEEGRWGEHFERTRAMFTELGIENVPL